MSRGLGRAHGELVVLVVHSGRILVEFVSWVLSVSAEGLRVFSLEVASAGAVCLTVETPLWSDRLGGMLAKLIIVDSVVV